MNDLTAIQKEAWEALKRSNTEKELENFRIRFLGRRGRIPMFLRGLKDLPLDQKRSVGKKANTLRKKLESAYTEAKASIAKDVSVNIDVTAPGHRPTRGHLHPFTSVRRMIEDLFLGLGFEIVETPEVEDPQYNFDLVNMPLGHPARDLMDTFWLTDGRLLRTHTTSGQIRVLRERTPPLRVLMPGRVFRREATDSTHETTFYQFEGLFIDKGASLADFKGIITDVLPRMLDQDIKIRIRPSYFPFVEPGLEIDVSCYLCASGCGVCKGTRWIEIMGAGMVHPILLKNAGIDPDAYSGFAFGGSIDRIAMLQFEIRDIRMFWSGNPHFLHQF